MSSIGNSSQEEEQTLREIIRLVDGYLTLLFVIVGSFFNTFSMIIFRRMNRGKFSLAQYYLVIFLVCQTALLCVCLLIYCVPTLLFGDTQAKGLYAYVILVAHAFSGPCYIIVTWMVLALTIERYFALQKPFAYRAIAKASRVKRIIAGVIIGAFIFSMPRLFDYKLGSSCDALPRNSSGVSNATECYTMVVATDLLSNKLYWNIYHVWLIIVFVTFVPSMIVLVLTLRISWFLHVNTQNRKMLSASQPHGVRSAKHIKGERESNVMLVMLIVKFAFSDPLPMLEGVIGAVAPEESPAKLALVVSVANFLMIFCCSINFIMFLLSGSHFRKECKRILFGNDSVVNSSGFSTDDGRFSRQSDVLPADRNVSMKGRPSIAESAFSESSFIRKG